MKTKTLIAASILALSATVSAQAADMIVRQEQPVVAVPMFSWTGFYAGGQVGGAWSDSNVDVRGRSTAYEGFNQNFSPDPSGFIGGLYAGYNFDLGNNLVLGAETDWVWADISKTKSAGYGADAISTTPYQVQGRIKEKWAGATRVRVGYAVDRWLPYIAGGVAYAKVDSSARFSTGETELSYLAGNKTLTGWTAGAGVDYAMTDNVILRIEYRYSDFGKKTFTNDNFGYRAKYKTNDFRVGVAYKF